MTEYGCKHCKEVCQKFKIALPKDLEKAISVVRDNLADGTIIESSFWPENILKTQTEPFSKVDSKGPWDDILIYYFECPECNQLFKLSAETYHGAGGSWQPIKENSL